jgi:hypothetical protein
LFPADIQCSGLVPISFTSASSCPDSVSGPDRKDLKELLLCLTSSLNRDFFANLGPELNLPRAVSLETSGTKELHFVLLGGSHLKNTIPHLQALGAKITDLTRSGWIANVASTQLLMNQVQGLGLPEDAVFVLDVLGNSSVRFKQEDGSTALPVKLNGGWHVLGEVSVMDDAMVTQTLSLIQHLYMHSYRRSHFILLPPIPRFVFGGCCNDLNHCSNVRNSNHGTVMISEHYRVRSAMKAEIVGRKASNVPI